MKLKRRPALALELLECRLVPVVGVVTIVSNGADLTITSDNTSATIVITAVGTNQVQVFDGSSVQGPYTVTGKLSVQTGTGFDHVELNLQTFSLAAAVDFKTSDGNDFISVHGTPGLGKLGSNLAIDSGNNTTSPSEEQTHIEGVSIAGSATINAGTGKHFVGIGQDNPTSISGSLAVNFGNGKQEVDIGSNASITASVTINFGDGKNIAYVGGSVREPSTATLIGGSLTIKAGMGIPDSFGHPEISISGATINGSATVQTGGGTYDFLLGETDVDTIIRGSFSLTSSAGMMSLAVNPDDAGAVRITGSAAVNLGGGTNTWNLAHDFSVGRDFSLTSGAGDDTLTLFSSKAGMVGGNLMVNLGNGANMFTFNGSAGSAMAGGLQYIGGTGMDNVTLNGKLGRQLVVLLAAGSDSFTYGAPFALMESVSAFSAYIDGGAGTDSFFNLSSMPSLTTKPGRIGFEM